MNDFLNRRVEYAEYMVEKGDSLFKIAKENNTTVADLIDINVLSSNTIYPGQILLVPKYVNDHIDNDKNDVIGTNVYFTYTTEEYDTVDKIANRFGVTPKVIGEYNDFGNILLVPGQNIVIPNSRTYVVEHGDTIDSVLAKTSRSAYELLKDNEDTIITTGTVLKY